MSNNNNNRKDNRPHHNSDKHQSASRPQKNNNGTSSQQFQSRAETIAVKKAKENHFINYGEKDRDFVITYNNSVEFKEILQRNCAMYRLAMDEVNELALYRPKRWLQNKNATAAEEALSLKFNHQANVIRRLPPKPPTIEELRTTRSEESQKEEETFATDSLDGAGLPGGGGKMPASQ